VAEEKKRFFQLQSSQGGAPDGSPLEAETLEKAQAQVLLGMGLELVEVDESGHEV